MYDFRSLRLKEKLKSGALSPGIWVSLPSPTACEVIADAGLDWVIVDAEHSPFNPETLQHMLMAFRGSATTPLIRVPSNDAVMIKQVLDMGWDGILIPQVNSVDEVKQAVEACRYPPVGIRGFGPRRAGNYYRDQDEYIKYANEAIICIIQIENVSGAEMIEEIVRVPGFDWIFFGPYDMSGSTDRVFDMTNPDLLKAIHKIYRVANSAGIPIGNAGAIESDVKKEIEMGSQLVVLGEDTGFLKGAIDDSVKKFQDIVGA